MSWFNVHCLQWKADDMHHTFYVLDGMHHATGGVSAVGLGKIF